MVVEREYYCVCVPLAAGVLLAAMISESFGKFSGEAYLAAGFSFFITASGAISSVRVRSLKQNMLFWVSLFLACGMLCHFGNTVAVWDSPSRLTELCAMAKAEVCSRIDSIPFSNIRSNALVKALITGERSSLDSGCKQAFRNAGAAHMLALSGMHLGVIYLLVRRILAIIGNTVQASRARSALIIALTATYTAICGAGPSLFRAWLFITLYEGGKMLGRRQKPGHVLCAALTIQLILRPCDVMEIGFQLSYLAMAGIVFIWPQMREWYKDDGPGKKIWDLASLSIACQLLTAPLSYFHFGTFPKYFLITNLVGAPLLSVVMFCSVGALFLSMTGIDAAWIYHTLEFPVISLADLMDTISSL